MGRQDAEQRLRQGHRCGALDMTRRGNALWCRRCGHAVDIKPRTVAFLTGRAVPLAERCTIFDPDGGSHMETFARGAFAITYPHDIKLRVNHNSRSAIPCALTFLETRDGLDFWASVPDSPQARSLLARADKIRGVSIECTHVETVPDRALRPGDIVVTRAELLGVSITVGDHGPAWFETRCTLTRLH
jgi:hypothetical protein